MYSIMEINEMVIILRLNSNPDIYMEILTHMPKNFQRTRKYADIRDITFKAGTFEPTVLIHLDGSRFELTYGAYERHNCEDIEFIILYGEHYQPMVFFADDVESVTGKEIFPEKKLDK